MIALAASLACTTATLAAPVAPEPVAPEPAPTPDLGFQARVNARFSVLASQVINLDLDTAPGRSLTVNIPISGRFETIEFAPHSVRHPNYEVLVDIGNGRLMPVDPQPERTIRGRVVLDEGSMVSGSMLPEGLAASIWLADGTRHWIEPLAGQVDGANAGDHVVYANTDVIPADGGCGNSRLADQAAAADPERPVPPPAALGGGDGPIMCAELACDADFEYYQDYGSSVSAVETRINLVTNTMNPQYETQTGITHAITTIIVRSSPADPYTSFNSETLLCEFITEWTNNQQSIVFDVAKLFTAREISGGTIGQAANFGEICDRQGCCGCGGFGLDDGAFCYSQNDCCGGLACSTDLMAHELGHLWDAFHCDPCNTTMRSFIGCFNTFTQQSINSIVAHRNSLSCLDEGTCAGLTEVGACCFGTNCAADTSIDDCESVGGVFQGDGSTCTPGLCSPVTGGCCMTCVCTITTPTACAAGGGVYAGDDVPCSTAFCPECGACCLPDGSCLDDATSASCTSSGGTFQGGATTCAGVTCPVGSNDFCAGATSVPASSSNAINNVNATPVQNDGGAGDPELPGGSPDCQWDNTPTDVHNTLWYSFVATFQSVEIQTCNTTDVADTIIALYSGSCGSLTQLACGEDDCGPAGTPYRSRICYDGLTVGQTYLVMVGNPGSWGGSDPGDITLDLQSPCPDITGACCLAGGSCQVLDEAACAAQGGAYEGGGTTCSPSPCPVPDGACCLPDGSCQENTTAADCGSSGGNYEGDDTACSEVTCPGPPCPEDLDGSGDVGFSDILQLIGAWGPCAGCPEDLDGSGDVGFSDILAVIGAWGPC